MGATRGYLEHVAIHVRDIAWHRRFFRDVLGMELREADGPDDAPRQVWLLGGLQLVADPDFAGPEGRMAHLGMMVEDAAAAIAAARRFGVGSLDKGENWLVLPDGLIVEILQAVPGSVGKALAVDARNDARPPRVVARERYWDDIAEGEEGMTPEVTVTKDMIAAFADLTGDHTPVHVDEAFAKASHFGGLVAHGLFGLALADGLKTRGALQFPPGASLGWTWDFLKPIRVGDRLSVRYRVGAMRPTKKPDWGIVTLPSELVNQHGEVVQKGEHRLMILRRPTEQGAKE